MFSSDTHHECIDNRIVDDATVPTEFNAFGDTWCALCGERILTAESHRRCDHCGSPFTRADDRAEVVLKGEEGVPLKDHFVVHAEPCYTAHTDTYDLA